MGNCFPFRYSRCTSSIVYMTDFGYCNYLQHLLAHFLDIHNNDIYIYLQNYRDIHIMIYNVMILCA